MSLMKKVPVLQSCQNGYFHQQVIRCQTGFTLLELLVVIVIIVTAAAVVVPNMGSRAQHARLASGVVRLDSLVRYARSRAVIERQKITVIPSGDGRWVYMRYVDGQNDDLYTPPLDLGEAVRLRIEQTGNSQEEHGIVFRPDGTTDQIVLVLSSNTGVRRLKLDPVRGRLLVQGP